MLGSSVLPLVANIMAHKVSYKADYFNIIKCILLVPNLRPPPPNLDYVLVPTQILFNSHGDFLTIAMYHYSRTIKSN